MIFHFRCVMYIQNYKATIFIPSQIQVYLIYYKF